MKTDKELWIAARIDELMNDAEWLLTVSDDWSDNAIDYANLQAEREHAAQTVAAAAIGEKL